MYLCLDVFRAAIKMQEGEEQRVRNKFCLEPTENSANTSGISKTAFGNKYSSRTRKFRGFKKFNPLNPELNPICYLLALLGAHHFLHVSRIRVKLLTLRLLMS